MFGEAEGFRASRGWEDLMEEKEGGGSVRITTARVVQR